MKTKQIIKALRQTPFLLELKIAAEAANRLEMLSVEQKKLHAKLAAMKVELDTLRDVTKNYETLLATLKRYAPCEECEDWDDGRGCTCPFSCKEGEHWSWRGAEDTNVPSKEEP